MIWTTLFWLGKTLHTSPLLKKKNYSNINYFNKAKCYICTRHEARTSKGQSGLTEAQAWFPKISITFLVQLMHCISHNLLPLSCSHYGPICISRYNSKQWTCLCLVKLLHFIQVYSMFLFDLIIYASLSNRVVRC